MDVQIVRLAAAQDDVVAFWQLMDLGWSKAAAVHRTTGFRRVHDGVFVTSWGPLTSRQLARAATLHAPGSVLSHHSAAAWWGFLWRDPGTEIVTRPGNGGPRAFAGADRDIALRVHRSQTVARFSTYREGLPITTAERTLIDLAPRVSGRRLAKALREAIRLRLVTAGSVIEACSRHKGHRGVARVRALASEFADLQVERTKSDAEAYALQVLNAAGVPRPLSNEKTAGYEADLTWRGHRLIIEIDGLQFHRLKDDDARKTVAWRAVGYDVRRIPSDVVFDHPERLLALAPIPSSP